MTKGDGHDRCISLFLAQLRLAMAKLGCRLILLCGAAVLLAAAPMAGSRLQNRATFSYISATTGFHETLQSNIVNIIILPQEALVLTSDLTVQRSPNSIVNLPHRLINTGNTSFTAAIHFNNQGGDDYDLVDLSMTVDLNNNGVADPGEPILNLGDTVYLEPGETVHLVLTGTIPAMVPVDQEAKVFISATTTGQNVQAINVDTSITTDRAVVPITKGVSNLAPQPGEASTFTLNMTNAGTAVATGIPVEVDGVPLSLVVVRDALPPNTGFVNLAQSPGTTPLYHRAGDPEHTYTSTPPSDLAQVDAIGLGRERLEIGERLTLSFVVVVNGNASGTISNVGEVHYFDGGDITSEMSNTVEANAPAVPPTISYYSDASFSDIAAAITIGRPLFVQADAAECNTDSTGRKI